MKGVEVQTTFAPHRQALQVLPTTAHPEKDEPHCYLCNRHLSYWCFSVSLLHSAHSAQHSALSTEHTLCGMEFIVLHGPYQIGLCNCVRSSKVSRPVEECCRHDVI